MLFYWPNCSLGIFCRASGIASVTVEKLQVNLGKRLWRVGSLLYDGTMMVDTRTPSTSRVAFRICCVEGEVELSMDAKHRLTAWMPNAQMEYGVWVWNPNCVTTNCLLHNLQTITNLYETAKRQSCTKQRCIFHYSLSLICFLFSHNFDESIF